jgi:hypothetical protein
LTQLIEKRKEYNIQVFLEFVDCEKAFDRVNRNKLWSLMIKRGFPQQLIRAVQNLYHETQKSKEKEKKIIKNLYKPRSKTRVPT